MVRPKRRASKDALVKISENISPEKNGGNNDTDYVPDVDEEMDTETIEDNEFLPPTIIRKHSAVTNNENGSVIVEADCPVVKKRGRPRKNKGPPRNEKEAYDAEKKMERKVQKWKTKREGICRIVTWTPVQKKQFQVAFKDLFKDEWLSNDNPSDELIKALALRVKGRSFEEVKKYFLHYLKLVSSTNKKNSLPIDKWFEVINAVTPKNDMLEQQMGFALAIAAQEPIEITTEEMMQPSSSKKMPQPNYQLLYRYIASSLANKPLPTLPPLESLIVEECMQSLIQQVVDLDSEDLRTSLRRIYLHMAKNPEQEQEFDYKEIENSLLQNISIFNPLGLNADSIVISKPNH